MKTYSDLTGIDKTDIIDYFNSNEDNRVSVISKKFNFKEYAVGFIKTLFKRPIKRSC